MIRIIVAGAAPYPIDCALYERMRYEADITENPVETGSAIADNIRPKQPVLEFEGVVSDTPMGRVALDPSRSVADGRPKPSRDAYDRFVAIHESRETVTVECSYGKFDQMALESVTTDKDPKSAKAFRFTATFRKIRIVTNTRTTVRMRLLTPGPGGKSRTSPALKQHLGERESKAWGEKLGIKDAIFVVSYFTFVRESVSKSLGPPIHTRPGDPSRGEQFPEYDCYPVQGGTVPDGYLTVRSGFDDPTVPHAPGESPYIYHPGRFVPTSYIGQDVHNTAPKHDPVPAKPPNGYLYNYDKKQWQDKNGNPITQTTPPPQNWRNVLWGV